LRRNPPRALNHREVADNLTGTRPEFVGAGCLGRGEVD